jgi:hypothetical protein
MANLESGCAAEMVEVPTSLGLDGGAASRAYAVDVRQTVPVGKGTPFAGRWR